MLNLKKTTFDVLARVSVDRIFRSLNKRRILIVMYHGITLKPLEPSCWWQLPLTKFQWQMQYLKDHYTVLPLKEIFMKLDRGEPLPDYTAAITFDDGFMNNYTVAYPVLKQLGLAATIFVTTDLIGTERLLWMDEMFILFSETRQTSINLERFNLGSFSLYNNQQKQQAFFVICTYMKEAKVTAKNIVLEELRRQLQGPPRGHSQRDHFKLLTWEQIEMMKHEGLIDFGAHTCSHEILSQADNDTVSREIKDSCRKINPTAPVLFAYPNGRKTDYDGRAKETLKSIGALCALSTVSGLNTPDTDRLELKRISIGEDITVSLFKLACSGFIDFMKTRLKPREGTFVSA